MSDMTRFFDALLLPLVLEAFASSAGAPRKYSCVWTLGLQELLIRIEVMHFSHVLVARQLDSARPNRLE